MLISADARRIPLLDRCVQCVVTSPPYWGLRDYGHADQLGLEPTPDAYVANLVTVFREVWRVMKDDGTLWLNLGDSYAQGGQNSGSTIETLTPRQRSNAGCRYERRIAPNGMKPKDLCGIPWRVAFALQGEGWYLRSDIIWSKPNPMPESVTDRPTKAHEYIFLLSKSERYYYDANALREPHLEASIERFKPGAEPPSAARRKGAEGFPGGQFHTFAADQQLHPNGRNARSVWTITTQPYPDAHFATFPEALPERCIKAGSRLGDLVFDPFVGSGTVGAVAERLGRRWVGTDIAYHGLSAVRTAQRGLKWA